MTVPAESVIDGVYYPESDGVPMGESDLHVELLAELLTGLRAHLKVVSDLYVACDLIVYYEKDVPGQKVVPDIFAVRGVSRHPRTSWFTWLEGAGPEFVLEVMSDSSHIEDQGNKKVLYAEMGVKEYFLFDPQHRYLKPCLQGYRLVAGEWERLAGTRLRSEVLGVDFLLEDDTLRMVDACTGERILRRVEEGEARREAETRAQQETRARQVAEIRAQRETEARQEAEIRAQRESTARQVAEIRAQEQAEARLREAEARQAAEETVRQERQARLALEAEMARLRPVGREDSSLSSEP